LQPLIELDHVWFHYQPEDVPKDHWAVQDLTLRIFPGEDVAVIGLNGSGKSTLARLFNGLLVPVEGEVKVGGMPTRDPSCLWEIRRRVGLVFQNPENQIVASTVEEDVAFGLENLGIPAEQMERRIRLALEKTGLSGFRQTPPHLLSGGQKQRLAIAGVLAMEPEVIVLDEATSMLDPVGRREVLGVIRELHAGGTAVVRVTHRADEAFQADRIIVLDRGRLALDLPVAEMYRRAHLLEEWGLDVPAEIRLHRLLIARGWPLPYPITGREELVKAICRCLSKI
jgi:energy-coupling factor transport system ATP-binding protein